MEMPVFKAIPTLIYTLTLLLFASCGRNTNDVADSIDGHNSNDTTGIENLGESFVAAWNQHNAKAIADLWTVDGDFLSPWASTDLIKGREAIEKYFSEEYKTMLKDASIELAINNVHFIDPDTAFTEANFTISGINIAGVQAVPFNDQAIFVMVQQDGKWKIKIARPY